MVLLTFGVLFLIYFSITLIFGDNSLLRYFQLQTIRSDVQSEIELIERRNEDLNGQIEAGKKDPGLIEELARKQGLTKENELIFKFQEEK